MPLKISPTCSLLTWMAFKVCAAAAGLNNGDELGCFRLGVCFFWGHWRAAGPYCPHYIEL